MTNRRLAIALVAIVLGVSGCGGAGAAGSASGGADPASATTTSRPSAGSTPDARSTTSRALIASTEPSFGTAPIGPTETAIVLSITDGDTIRVDRGHGSERLRYIGMNTPEVGDPGAAEATIANARLVKGETIVLERDVSETDKYGRLLRYVWLSAGGQWTFVNLELVRLGVAQAATYPPDVRYASLFVEAQRAARAAGLGLWAPSPQPTVTSQAGASPG